jgi:hypothetical protein
MAFAFLHTSFGLVVPEQTLSMVKISSLKTGIQQLPLSMCRWPLWVASEDRVTQISGAGAADAKAGWVDPVSFEQLWLPEDLPPPSTHIALAAVIKDGTPRYLLPCLEASITTVSGATGTVWHNRGMSSVPLGGQWVVWGETPLKALRLFSFSSALPPPDGAGDAADEEVTGEADAPDEPAWEPLQAEADRPGGGGQSVEAAVSAIVRVLAEAGAEIAELGQGYHFVSARVGSTSLPEGAVRPGRQLRLILATALDDPNPNDDEWAGEMLSFGLCDTSVYAVPAGGESEFMPDCYRPLYGAAAAGSQ